MLKYGIRQSRSLNSIPLYHLCTDNNVALCGAGRWPNYLPLIIKKVKPKRQLCKRCASAASNMRMAAMIAAQHMGEENEWDSDMYEAVRTSSLPSKFPK